MNNKNNKKNKKQSGGFINMNDPVTMGIIISLVVVVCVVCIYGGLVYFGYSANPLDWFNSANTPDINMRTVEENLPTPTPMPGNNTEAFTGGRKLFRRRR